MDLQKFSSELQELTFEQANELSGGESLWYWIAYGVGAAGRGIADAWEWKEKNWTQPAELVGVK